MSETTPSPAPSAAPKKRSWLRCGCIAGMLLAVGLVGLLALAPLLIPANWIRDAVIEAVSEQTGHACTLEAASFTWDGQVRLTSFSLASATPGDPAPLTIETLDLKADLWALLEHRVEIHSITIDGAKASLGCDNTGRWNLKMLTRAKASRHSTESIPVARAGAGEPQIRLQAIALNDVAIHYEDARDGTLIDVILDQTTLQMASSDNTASINGAVRQAGADAAPPITMTGGMTMPSRNLLQQPTDVALSLQLTQTNLAVLTEAVPSLRPYLQSGTVTGLCNIMVDAKTLRVETDGLQFSNAAIPDLALQGIPVLPDTAVQGALTLPTDWSQLALENLSAANEVLALTALTGAIDLNTSQTTAPLAGNATLQLTSLNRMLREAGLGGALPPGLGGDLQTRVALHLTTGGAAPAIQLQGGTVTIPVAKGEGPLAVQPRGTIHLTPAEGHYALRAELSDSRVDVPATPWAGHLRFRIDGAVEGDTDLQAIHLRDLRLQDPENAAAVSLVLDGTVSSPQGQSPTAQLTLAGTLDGAAFSETLRMEPWSQGARLQGPLAVNIETAFDATGMRLRPGGEGGALLWTAKAIEFSWPGQLPTPITLPQAVLRGDEVRYDLAADTLACTRLSFQSNTLGASVSFSALPSQDRLTLQYGLSARPAGLKPLLDLAGVPDLPVTKLRGTGILHTDPEGMTLTKSELVASLPLQTELYLFPSGRIQATAGGGWRWTPETGATLLRQEMVLQEKAYDILTLQAIEGTQVTAGGNQGTGVNQAALAMPDLAYLPHLLAPWRSIPAARSLEESLAGLTLRGGPALLISYHGTPQQHTATIAGDASNLLIARDRYVYFQNPETRIELVCSSDLAGKRIELKKLSLLDTQEAFLIVGAGTLHRVDATQGGLMLGKESTVTASLDLEKLQARSHVIAEANYQTSGAAAVTINAEGAANQLAIGLSLVGQDVRVQAPGERVAALAMPKNTIQAQAVVDCGRALEFVALSEEDAQRTPLERLTVTAGTVQGDGVLVYHVPITQIQAPWSMDKGYLRIGTIDPQSGQVNAWASADAGGDARVAARLNFRPGKEGGRIMVLLPGIDLAKAVGDIEGQIRVAQGTLYFPDPSSQVYPQISWQTFNSETIRKTLLIENGTFRATDVMIDNIRPGGRVGSVAINILQQLAAALGGDPSRALGGKRLEDHSYSFAEASGTLLHREQRTDLDSTWIGKDTADYRVTARVQGQETIHVAIFPIANVDRLMPVDGLAKQLKKRDLGKYIDADQFENDLRNLLERMGQHQELAFGVTGPYASPQTWGIQKMVEKVLSAAVKTLLPNAARGLLRGILDKNKKDETPQPAEDGTPPAEQKQQPEEEKSDKDKFKDLLRGIF